VEPLAVSALRQSPISALHNLQVSAEGDTIVLMGRVGSYYYKQLAQEAVISVAAGREIVNQIRVLKPARPA
jgi:osmotically-inducible protein OsmY